MLQFVAAVVRHDGRDAMVLHRLRLVAEAPRRTAETHRAAAAETARRRVAAHTDFRHRRQLFATARRRRQAGGIQRQFHAAVVIRIVQDLRIRDFQRQ